MQPELAAVDGAMAATDAFLATFNAGDARGHAETLGYPHVRLAGGNVWIWEDVDEAEAAMAAAIPALRARVGWDHSAWDHRDVIHATDEKVHLDVQFTRYRADGSVIGVYPAISAVVRSGARWLVQCRSSFAPCPLPVLGVIAHLWCRRSRRERKEGYASSGA